LRPASVLRGWSLSASAPLPDFRWERIFSRDSPTRAYEGVKRLFYGATNTSLAEQMEFETEWLTDMAGTADVQEGIAAFLAKRAPQFNGH
jgi:enoyl-CoA hydratase/carnithine racemase